MRLYPICILLLLSAGCLGNVLNVPSGEYPSIQQAINDSNSGDTIIVAPGRYFENINFLGKAITVCSTDPNDPNIVAATIIDGNQPADVNFGSVVTFENGETSASVLEGFTITGGSGSWLKVYWEYKGYLWNRCGGGILCSNYSSPTIRKNIITNNIAGQGGGVYCYDHSNAIITDNTIADNNAIIHHGYADPDANDPNIYDHGDGGAIVAFQYCDAIVKNNTISHNHADLYGGGIHFRQWSDGLIENNLITQNWSSLGAGVHITYTSASAIRKNTITENIAGPGGGGGIYIYYLSTPLVEQNLITQNSSSNGAGIGVYWESNPIIRNNIIVKNLAGAGIRIVSLTPIITNNTISFNENGGIQYESYASPVITNNIITSNGSGKGINASSITGTITYNNVWGHSVGNYSSLIGDLTGISGNISAEPNFVDADNNDYHLSCFSPCINAGDPNTAVTDINDFDNQPRLAGQFADIGAYEAKPVWNITKDTKYDNIQSAINDTNEFNTIVVTPGRYYENIEFGSTNFVLTSVNPDDPEIVEATVIDANFTGRAVTIEEPVDNNTILEGFTITGGTAIHGGGIICYYSPIIRKNIITNNSSPTYKGGGVYFWSSNAECLFENNIVVNNQAMTGGGICADTHSNVTIRHNTIKENTATFGAGINCQMATKITINNNLITQNISSFQGGGILCANCDADIYNNLITANKAATGGGLLSAIVTTKICNNTITGNMADDGSGIYFYSTNGNVTNNIISDNVVSYGIYDDPNHPSTLATSNNNVWNNQPANYGGCLSDQTGINGNISTDPNFVDLGYWDDANTPADTNDDFFVIGNYHLLPGSACINNGDNNSVPAQLTTDIDDEQRIFDDVVDMGADEFVTNIADFNGDGIVDFEDLFVYSQDWLCNVNGNSPADFIDDNFIDFADFAVFAENWLWKGGWRN